MSLPFLWAGQWELASPVHSKHGDLLHLSGPCKKRGRSCSCSCVWVREGGAISAVPSLVMGQAGLGAFLNSTLLASSPFPQRGAGSRRRSSRQSWSHPLWSCLPRAEAVGVSHCLWNYLSFSVMYIRSRGSDAPESGT